MTASTVDSFFLEVMGVYDRVGMKNGRPFYRKLDDPTIILSFDDVSTAWRVAQILPIQNPPIRDPPRRLPELQNPPRRNPPRRLPEIQNPPRRFRPKRHPSIQNPPIQNPPSQNPSKSSRRNLLFQNPPAKIHPSNSTRTLRQFSPRQNPAESFPTWDEIHSATGQSSFHVYPILWAANTEFCPNKDSWKKWWMNYNSHEPTPFTNSVDVYTCNGRQQNAWNGESE